jgi:hypothetical protein
LQCFAIAGGTGGAGVGVGGVVVGPGAGAGAGAGPGSTASGAGEAKSSTPGAAPPLHATRERRRNEPRRECLVLMVISP